MKCEVCHKNEAIKETAYILSKVVLVNVCQACNEDLENMYHILSTRYEIRRMSAHGEERQNEWK